MKPFTCDKQNIQTIPVRIGLMGASLDTGNQGVSALAASLAKLVRIFNPNARITLFIGNRSSEPQKISDASGTFYLDVQNYRLSPKAVFHRHMFVIFCKALLYAYIPSAKVRKHIIQSNEYLQALVQCDFLGDIRGGDSFSDIYGLNRFVIGCLPAIVALLVGKKLVLLPQTYGPYHSFVAKLLARYILVRADAVLARDTEGAETIQSLFVGKSQTVDVKFCPDVAFMLDAIVPAELQIMPLLPDSGSSELIGINVNGLMYYGGYTRENMFDLHLDYRLFLDKIIDALLQETQMHIIFIPHTYMPPGDVNSDTQASREVINKFADSAGAHRLHLVEKEYDQSEIKAVIGQCSFFIGSRMHSCIAALSQGVPTVAVAYSKKFIGVFNSINAGSFVVDSRVEDTDTALQKTLGIFYLRERYRESIAGNVKTVMGDIREVFETLFFRYKSASGRHQKK